MALQSQLRRLAKEVDRINEKISKHDDFFKDLKELMKIFVYENTKTAIKLQEYKEENEEYLAQKEKEMAELKKEWDRRYEQKEKELAEFREEWRKYHEKKDKEIEKLNKMWGDLVNKWGTMVEDIIVPGIPAVLDRRFNLQVKRLLQNAKSKINGRSREYDVIVLAGDYVFVIYVKSTFREKHFEDFENALREFPEFFPEYKEYKIVPVISAFNFEDGTINKATRKRWLALQMGGDYLDFVNVDKVKLPQIT
jgi:hypothetical protein